MARAVGLGSGEAWLRLLTLPCLVLRRLRRRCQQSLFSLSLAIVFGIGVGCLSGAYCGAQSATDDSSSIHGTVINSVTLEPIARALVSSPDHRFATLTNSEGRFEFTLAKPDSAEDSNDPSRGARRPTSNRPYSLMARKPGFLSDPNPQGNVLRTGPALDVTLVLIPEAVIAGTVALPTSEAPDAITLQLFRRQIQDGRARWALAGTSQTKSDGQFRFAELQAGT